MTSHYSTREEESASPPVALPIALPLSPISLKPSSDPVVDFLQSLGLRPNDGSWSKDCEQWKVIPLTPSQLHQLEQLSSDPVLEGYFKFELQARFDLDRSGSCMLVRMAKAPHEFLISALSHEIKRQLEAIGNDQTTTMVLRENARGIKELRHTTLNLPGSQRSPDNSFQHASAVQPDVVLEVASSQHEKCLKKIAREYLATTAGRIHVVIGVKLYSGATKAAKISV
ncbi:MAG: hypothetical protein M1826_006416 [Phylliscum demangeonii]|nr:MAG: hypothetical protein M1826_006416 [Phylliscum demangeonii]